MDKLTLKVTVKCIKGNCPVYQEGDFFTIADGYVLDARVPLCMHSLASVMPYYVALSRGIKPKDLGLGVGNKAYVQCLDPCHITGGGTVIFEISQEG